MATRTIPHIVEFGSFPRLFTNEHVESKVKKLDPYLARIEAFVEQKGGGVIIRKAAGGYSLFHESSGKPVARFRPTGKGDAVEVKWWSHRDRWDDIGDFGPLVMPLDQALDYVAKDPIGCFWHDVSPTATRSRNGS